MDVGRLANVLLRLDDTGAVPREAMSLPLGTPLSARVVGATGGGWTLDVGGREVVAHSSMPLLAGEELQVVASRVGDTIELRVLAAGPHFDARQYAAATLLESGARQGPVGLLPSAARLLAWLVDGDAPPGPAAEATAAGHATLVTALKQHLDPIDGAMSPTEIAARLQSMMESGGVLFERRVTDVLSGRASSVPSDARVLLAVIDRLLSDAERRTDACGAVSPDPRRALLEHAREDYQLLAGRVLGRALDMAFAWVRDGVLDVRFPLAFRDGTGVTRLRIGHRGARPSDAATAQPFTFDLRVDLPEVGRLEAWVQWAGREMTARVFVDRPELHPLVTEEAANLTGSLQRAGFSRVDLAIVVDAVRFATCDEPSLPAPPVGGSVFNARV